MALNEALNLPGLPLASKFLGNIPAAPAGRVGPRELAPIQEELRGAISKAEQDVGRADIAIEKAKREEEANKLAITAETKEKLAKDLREMPEAEALRESRKELAGMHFVPTRDTIQDIAGLFGLIGVIGMVAGKGNALNAMYAMNGMMEGHRKGRQDLFKQQAAEFDKNFKAMQAKVQQAVAEYEEAVKLKTTDAEAGEIKKQVALAKMNSPLMTAMDAKLGEVRTLNTLKDTEKSLDKSVALINSLQDAEDARKEREEDRKQRERQHRETLASNERMRRATIAAANARAANRVSKKGEFQADYISEIIGRRVDPDAASKAAAAMTFKQQLGELKDLNMKLGGAAGLKVSAVDYINKFLSTRAGPDGKFTAQDLQAAYDGLQNEKSFRSMSDNSKILAKKELDSVMTYLQTKYGNRAPVAEFKAAQTVLNRGNMTTTAYNNVLNQEMKSADSRLLSAGYTPRDILNLNRHFAENRNELELLYQEGGEEPATAPAQPSTTQQPMQPSAPKEGDKSTSKSGKPIIFRNGAWHYGQ